MNTTLHKRPSPVLRAATMINGFQVLRCRDPKKLAIMFCKIQRRCYWFWQADWRYWNKVLRHVRSFEG